MKVMIRFLIARTEADLDMVRTVGLVEIEEAVNEIRLISVDEKARKEAFDREAQIADTVNYFASAERKGRAEIIETMRKSGMSEEQINSILKR